MRIVFVQAGLAAGGAEKIVNMLAHHREDRGDRVDVIAVNATDTRSYFPYSPGVTLHALGAGSGPLFMRPLSRAARLRRLLHRLEPDIVLSFLTKVNVATSFAAAGLDAATIMSERNNFKVQKMSPLWRRLSPIAWTRATRLVMQTEQARASLPAKLRRRAVVIPNPVAALAPRMRTAHSAPRFVAVGRLDRQKGFDLLLEAFARAAAALPSASLVIFGEGPERGALESLASRLGIGGRVELRGVTKSPQEWLDAGNVFVLSSRFEGFPNVLLEALAAGMATVAVDCPWGASEIFGGAPVFPLVPMGDVGALASALVEIGGDPYLVQRLEELGPRIAARFSQAAVFDRWDELIADLAPERVRARPALALAGA